MYSQNEPDLIKIAIIRLANYLRKSYLQKTFHTLLVPHPQRSRKSDFAIPAIPCITRHPGPTICSTFCSTFFQFSARFRQFTIVYCRSLQFPSRVHNLLFYKALHKKRALKQFVSVHYAFMLREIARPMSHAQTL